MNDEMNRMLELVRRLKETSYAYEEHQTSVR